MKNAQLAASLSLMSATQRSRCNKPLSDVRKEVTAAIHNDMDAHGFADRGCRYHFGDGFETCTRRCHSHAWIDSHELSGADRRLAIAGAVTTFQWIAHLPRTLYAE